MAVTLPSFQDQIKDTVSRFIADKSREIIDREIKESQERVRKSIENEALKLSMHLAQMMRVDMSGDGITISIIKKNGFS